MGAPLAVRCAAASKPARRLLPTLSRRSRRAFTARDARDAGLEDDPVAQAACRAGGVPCKEVFEALAVADAAAGVLALGAERVAVVDLAAGHGLLGLAFALRLGRGRVRSVLAVDVKRPPTFNRIHAEVLRDNPWLAGRVRFAVGRLQGLRTEPKGGADDERCVVLSAHACGDLTDAVLDLAVCSRCPVAVLPCCHVLRGRPTSAPPGVAPDRHVDAERARGLREAGFRVVETTIASDITPKNRLILGEPPVGIEKEGLAFPAEPLPESPWRWHAARVELNK